MVNFHFGGRFTLREINGSWYIYDRELMTTTDRLLGVHTFTKAEKALLRYKALHDDKD